MVAQARPSWPAVPSLPPPSSDAAIAATLSWVTHCGARRRGDDAQFCVLLSPRDCWRSAQCIAVVDSCAEASRWAESLARALPTADGGRSAQRPVLVVKCAAMGGFGFTSRPSQPQPCAQPTPHSRAGVRRYGDGDWAAEWDSAYKTWRRADNLPSVATSTASMAGVVDVATYSGHGRSGAVSQRNQGRSTELRFPHHSSEARGAQPERRADHDGALTPPARHRDERVWARECTLPPPHVSAASSSRRTDNVVAQGSSPAAVPPSLSQWAFPRPLIILLFLLLPLPTPSPAPSPWPVVRRRAAALVFLRAPGRWRSPRSRYRRRPPTPPQSARPALSSSTPRHPTTPSRSAPPSSPCRRSWCRSRRSCATSTRCVRPPCA